jgi:hypothetical protein
MRSLLTNLADYSRQLLQVGTPPMTIFTAGGARPSQDIIQLSLLARIANALEGNEGQLTARLTIDPNLADDFRNMVGDKLDGRPMALAITRWKFNNEFGVEVALAYEEGEVLFLLGRYWEFVTTNATERSQGHA